VAITSPGNAPLGPAGRGFQHPPSILGFTQSLAKNGCLYPLCHHSGSVGSEPEYLSWHSFDALSQNSLHKDRAERRSELARVHGDSKPASGLTSGVGKIPGSSWLALPHLPNTNRNSGDKVEHNNCRKRSPEPKSEARTPTVSAEYIVHRSPSRGESQGCDNFDRMEVARLDEIRSVTVAPAVIERTMKVLRIYGSHRSKALPFGLARWDWASEVS
jgi:hypothetical protein